MTDTRTLAEIKRNPIIVEDSTLLLDTGHFEMISRVAGVMASCATMPDHVRGKPGDAFRIAEQAFRWNMSPFLVADKTFFVSGKLAYEGQLIAAVINTRAGLEHPLNYEFEGDPSKPRTLRLKISGHFKGEESDRHLTVAWETGRAMAKGAARLWDSQPEQQLVYYGVRVWARRFAPEVILGCYTPEELRIADDVLQQRSEQAKDITPEPTDPLDRVERAIKQAERARKKAAEGQDQVLYAKKDEHDSPGEAGRDGDEEAA